MRMQRVCRQEITRSFEEKNGFAGEEVEQSGSGAFSPGADCTALSASPWPAGSKGQGAEVAAGGSCLEAGRLQTGQAIWQCKPHFVLSSGYFISHRVSAVPVHKTWLAALPCNLFDHGNFFDRLPCDFLIYQIEFNNSLLLSPFISPLGFTCDCCLFYPFELWIYFPTVKNLAVWVHVYYVKTRNRIVVMLGN